MFHLHNRKRHDITTPSGKVIMVEGTKEESRAMFEHFAEKHPELLQKAAKATGFTLKAK